MTTNQQNREEWEKELEFNLPKYGVTVNGNHEEFWNVNKKELKQFIHSACQSAEQRGIEKGKIELYNTFLEKDIRDSKIDREKLVIELTKFEYDNKTR